MPRSIRFRELGRGRPLADFAGGWAWLPTKRSAAGHYFELIGEQLRSVCGAAERPAEARAFALVLGFHTCLRCRRGLAVRREASFDR